MTASVQSFISDFSAHNASRGSFSSVTVLSPQQNVEGFGEDVEGFGEDEEGFGGKFRDYPDENNLGKRIEAFRDQFQKIYKTKKTYGCQDCKLKRAIKRPFSHICQKHFNNSCGICDFPFGKSIHAPTYHLQSINSRLCSAVFDELMNSLINNP